ncbi:MAG: D-alanyl-D-alanine carboxypeptidase [Clostridia bacterium]|nr:D-alanyl-D-alanine carboxypeptidase [Clostridia bacterium]MDD4047459.1 D-alanyl-D-alanine carboxypeptidase [Clostridia bacterium]
MKKIFVVLSMFVFILFYNVPLLAVCNISATSGILLDAETGNILYNKDAFVSRSPASTTKILTSILAIECGNLNDIVTVSKEAASVGEASLNLNAFDRLTLNELLHGALIKSGNDACVAIAEHISLSEEEFVGLMNLKARTLGALNTTFCNTNGLPYTGHSTTAYDLAQITRYALKNSVFREIVKTKYYTMKWTEPKRSRYLKNTNKLLWSFPQATGVKTGTTINAGKCLVASAIKNNKELIVVILNSHDRFSDAKKLLEYGFKVKEN